MEKPCRYMKLVKPCIFLHLYSCTHSEVVHIQKLYNWYKESPTLYTAKSYICGRNSLINFLSPRLAQCAMDHHSCNTASEEYSQCQLAKCVVIVWLYDSVLVWLVIFCISLCLDVIELISAQKLCAKAFITSCDGHDKHTTMLFIGMV